MIDIKTFCGAPTNCGGVVEDTPVYKAQNIFTTQIGFLKYAAAFGLDLATFFSEEYQIQTQSFMAYATKKLAENYISPSTVSNYLTTFEDRHTFTFKKAEV